MMHNALPHLSDIEAAATRLAPANVTQTPLIKLYERGSLRVFAKLECLQPGARCYKVRGAFNVLQEMQEKSPDLLAQLRQRGIVTASAGNFAIALGQAAHTFGLPLTVLVPSGASRAKLRRMQRIAPNAQVYEVTAEAWWQSMLTERAVGVEADGRPVADAFFISPARNMAVMAGNGTIGLEIADQLPPAPTRDLHVIAPYGGGGLCIGIASALKQCARSSRCQVAACEVSTGAPFSASLAAGKPVTVEHTPSFVDGIGARGVLPDNFERARQVLDGALVVTPEEILTSCQDLLTNHGLVVEGAGAASLAAARRYYAEAHTQQPIDLVCVLSGGNIALPLLMDAATEIA